MKLKSILYLITLTVIIFLGGFLRLVNLDKNPAGFYVDEAVTGYNSWSILETGKDEYGKAFPLAFRFFGSYTPPLYTYLTAAVIFFNGLSVFSVRLVSAISGILLILLIFIFLKKILITKNSWLYFFGMILVAISPWSIFYSRIGYEIHLAFFIYSMGIYLAWIGLKKPWFLLPGFICLALSALTYHAEKILAPLTVISFLILFRKDLFTQKFKKVTILAVFLFLLFFSPQIYLSLTPAGSARNSSFYFNQVFENSQKSNWPMVVSYPYFLSFEFFSQYFGYFSPKNLFFEPEADLQRSLPNLSTFFSWLIILYFFGLYRLIKNLNSKNYQWVLVLFLITPIPAALTTDPFSTQRALPLLLPLTVFLVLGFEQMLSIKKRTALFLTSILLLVSLVYLYRSYAVLLPNERAKDWGYGFEQLAKIIKTNPDEKFLIDTGRIKPAYVELTFFLKYPPQKLQESIDPNIKTNYYSHTNWSDYYKFGQIETRSMDFKKDSCTQQVIVGDEYTISDQQAAEHVLTKEFEIRSPIDEIIFVGFKTNPTKKCI